MLELWGMWNTPSFPSLPDLLKPEKAEPDSVLSIGQIQLFDLNCMTRNDMLN